jgi:uncharacterized protein
MAELKSHNEQSMEEILAAIKHIMAEEGVMPAEPVEATAPPVPDEKPAPIQAAAQETAAAAAAPEPSTVIEPVATSPTEETRKPAVSASTAAFPPRLPPVQDAILDLTDRIDEDESPAKPTITPLSSAPSFAAGRLNRPPPLKSSFGLSESSAKRIVSDSTLAASVANLSQIASVAAARKQQELALGDVSRTLEEMVRELLRPFLKEWLDSHLPKLVERLVRDEIGRLVRDAEGRS